MRRRLGTAAVTAALLALPALAACGDDPAPAGDPGGAAGIMLADAGVGVAEALAAPPSDELVAVRAFVIVAADGSARLCDALAESHPPQCGGASMALTGLPDGFLTGLRTSGGVTWSDAPVQLLGRVRGDAFANDPEALVAG
jgi:hypothetical protein